uniref:O-acetyl-ADP-ribose deacetylase C6orf130 n=1 Tax=Melanaphis sacchari TaxID=742174 RepID=A0A2H8U190_9HEMI
MDKKKSSKTKRNKEEVKNEYNESAKFNKKKKKKNIILLNLPCKTEGEDKEINHGDSLLESPLSAYNQNIYEEQAVNQSFCKDQKGSKNKMCEKYSYKCTSKLDDIHNWLKNDLDKKEVCKSFHDDDKEGCVNNEKQNHSKRVQNQRKNSDRDFIVDKCIQKKGNDRKNTDLHDTHKSINDGERSSFNNKKKNQFFDHENVCEKPNCSKSDQNQSKFSDKSFSADKYNQTKSYNRNDCHSYEDTPKSVNTDGKRSSKNNKKKSSYQGMYSKKNDQKQRKNEICADDSLKQNEVQDRNIDLHKKPLINLKGCIIKEIDEDLFKLPKDYSLAHCIAEDLRMGAGIAVEFKRIFGGIGKLADQNLKVGDVGVVQRHNQYALYLVTKKYSYGKPTMNTMEKALRSLFTKMKNLNLTKLGIPKIGCGLDKLDWFDTRDLIIDIFSGSGIDITVCVPSKLLDSKTLQRLKVYITPNNLWDMESKTTIVLFIDLEKVCKNNWEDYVVNKVDTKYPFKENLLKDVKNKKLNPGAITTYNVNNEVIICMFFTQNSLYSSLEDGFKSIDQTFKYYKYLAIQSGPIEPSISLKHISLIVLILRSTSHLCELWLCGDVNQTSVINYDEYYRNLNTSMNYSFQLSSPIQNNNKYNDNRQSFNVKKTSNQN